MRQGQFNKNVSIDDVDFHVFTTVNVSSATENISTIMVTTAINDTTCRDFKYARRFVNTVDKFIHGLVYNMQLRFADLETKNRFISDNGNNWSDTTKVRPCFDENQGVE